MVQAKKSVINSSAYFAVHMASHIEAMACVLQIVTFEVVDKRMGHKGEDKLW